MINMRSKVEMEEELNQLIADKMKMDRFFSLYLDKFGSKMDPDKPNTKVWDLYKSKLKEYTELDRKMKTLNYYIKAN